MVTWQEVLEEWGYPGDIWEVASMLEEMGLDPEYYRNRKLELATYLTKYVREKYNLKVGKLGAYEDCKQWCVVPILCDFICWLWSMIAPYSVDLAGMVIGGIASWLLPGYYKAIGVAIVVFFIYDLLKKLGLIPQQGE